MALPVGQPSASEFECAICLNLLFRPVVGESARYVI